MIISLHIFYFHGFGSIYVYLFDNAAKSPHLSVKLPFSTTSRYPRIIFSPSKRPSLLRFCLSHILLPCAAACEQQHNVARLVTSGLGRRFLATSPAADQQPAFGVLEATEAKSHLPDFDLVRLLRGLPAGVCGVHFVVLISHFVGVCARSCWTYENRTSGRPASSGPRRPSRSVRVSRTSSFAPPQPRSRC